MAMLICLGDKCVAAGAAAVAAAERDRDWPVGGHSFRCRQDVNEDGDDRLSLSSSKLSQK